MHRPADVNGLFRHPYDVLFVSDERKPARLRCPENIAPVTLDRHTLVCTSRSSPKGVGTCWYFLYFYSVRSDFSFRNAVCVSCLGNNFCRSISQGIGRWWNDVGIVHIYVAAHDWNDLQCLWIRFWVRITILQEIYHAKADFAWTLITSIAKKFALWIFTQFFLLPEWAF